MSHDKKKDAKRGGFGRKLVMLLVLAAVALGATWYLDPEFVQSKFELLTAMLRG